MNKKSRILQLFTAQDTTKHNIFKLKVENLKLKVITINFPFFVIQSTINLYLFHLSKLEKIRKTTSVFRFARYPAGLIYVRIAKVGLLTYPVCCAFPAFASGKECNKPKLLHWIGVGIHSNRYCSGFAPDSLFTLQPALWRLGSLCIAKVCNSINSSKCFCWIFNSFTSLYLRYNFFC